jgi:signal transduction histidine kinase
VEVGQLVNDIGHTHTLVAKSKNISLQFNLPQESRTVSLDKNLFQRVLDNLLSNALKFAPPASTVALQVTHSVDRADANHVRIKIADEGPGIPPEAREQIFNKFAVVPLKQSGISQFGLRLAFAKMVVEAHGGRIFVEANDPVGSVFIIEI